MVIYGGFMNRNKCKGCQWYGKPYWSIINPCDSCPREDMEVQAFTIKQYGKTYKIIEELQQKVEQLENIRKEAIEYVETIQKSENNINPYILHAPTLLNILSKGE